MKSEYIALPRSHIPIAPHVFIMVFFFPFGEETAKCAVSDRLTTGFNGGNKLEPEDGFEALKRDVADYKAKIVPEFEAVPTSQEHVDLAIEHLQLHLDECVERKEGTALYPFSVSYVGTVIQDFDDTIDELRNSYEVTDTEPLEAVRDKLQAWLDEMDRQHVPHPSYPEGPA